MSERTVQASTFKATCLQLLDEVATNHRTVLITKHGKPVARLVPLDAGRSTAGSVTLLSDDDEDYFSAGEHWDADA